MTVVLVQIMRSSKVTFFLKKLYRILFVLGRLIVRPELKIFLFIFFLYFISNSHEGISKEQGSSLIAIHRNIQLIALSTPPDKDFDIPVMPPKQALKVIRKSIDLIYANSPYTANRLVELPGRLRGRKYSLGTIRNAGSQVVYKKEMSSHP